MKAVLALTVLASLVGFDPPGNELKIKLGNQKWKNGWGTQTMSALKRLVGAKEVSQDDFSQGVGTYIVKFDAPPPLTMAAIKKETGSYSINGIELKLTTKITQKKEDFYAGMIQLVKGTPEDAYTKLGELVKAKKTILVVAGVLEEDQKGKQTLKLSSVGEPDKAKK